MSETTQQEITIAFNAIEDQREREQLLFALLKEQYPEGLEQAARVVRWEAERPELEKSYERLKELDDAKTGIIGGATFGLNDRDCVALSFSVHMSPSTAFGYYVFGDEIAEVIKKAGVSSVSQLNGKPCYYKEVDGYCRFMGMWGRIT